MDFFFFKFQIYENEIYIYKSNQIMTFSKKKKIKIIKWIKIISRFCQGIVHVSNKTPFQKKGQWKVDWVNERNMISEWAVWNVKYFCYFCFELAHYILKEKTNALNLIHQFTIFPHLIGHRRTRPFYQSAQVLTRYI